MTGRCPLLLVCGWGSLRKCGLCGGQCGAAGTAVPALHPGSGHPPAQLPGTPGLGMGCPPGRNSNLPIKSISIIRFLGKGIHFRYSGLCGFHLSKHVNCK